MWPCVPTNTAKFFDWDTAHRRQVGVAMQLLLCCGARPSWPQCRQGGWSVSGLFSTRMGALRSRACKGAEAKIQADGLGQCERLRRAVDCAPYLTLYASGVKDWSRSFWSAVLQHRFRFAREHNLAPPVSYGI